MKRIEAVVLNLIELLSASEYLNISEADIVK